MNKIFSEKKKKKKYSDDFINDIIERAWQNEDSTNNHGHTQDGRIVMLEKENS